MRNRTYKKGVILVVPIGTPKMNCMQDTFARARTRPGQARDDRVSCIQQNYALFVRFKEYYTFWCY